MHMSQEPHCDQGNKNPDFNVYLEQNLLSSVLQAERERGLRRFTFDDLITFLCVRYSRTVMKGNLLMSILNIYICIYLPYVQAYIRTTFTNSMASGKTSGFCADHSPLARKYPNL